MPLKYLCLLLLLSLKSFAQPGLQFGTEKLITVPADGMSTIKTADMDLDGDIDAVFNTELGIAWSSNDGAGNMSTPEIIDTQNKMLLLADINQDGAADMLVNGNNGVELFTNNGNMQFTVTNVTPFFLYNTITYLIATDLDQDGDVDVVSCGSGGLSYYENDGALSFTTHYIVADADEPTSVVAADFDGDGNLDLAASNHSYYGVIVSYNDGTESFLSAVTVGGQMDYTSALCAGDIDNDGDQDLVVTVALENKVIAFKNNGGIFSTSQTLDSNSSYPRSVVTDDIDHDGDLDVIAGGQPLRAYLNDGAGGFTMSDISARMGSANSIALADLNNDGNNDVLTVSEMNSPKACFAFSNGDATYSTANILMAPAQSIVALETADLDGDGFNDIISGSSEDKKLAWYKNVDGHSGDFTPQKIITDSLNGLACVKAADLDGDGDLDLLTSATTDQQISWFKNDGSGHFGPKQVIAGSVTGVSSIDCADLDNDGDQDLLFIRTGTNYVLWMQNLGGTFGSMTLVAYNFAATHVEAADMDGDGIKDILAMTENTAGGRWYKKNGSSWTSHTIPITAVAYWTKCADFDLDGDIDIVVGCDEYNGASLRWLENTGTGTFIQDHTIALTDWSVFVNAADIDNDGDLDLLNEGSSWLENYGGGHFSGVKDLDFTYTFLLTYNIGGRQCVAGDFDNDGDMDLVAGGYDKISMLPNNHYQNRQLRGSFYVDINQNGMKDSLEPPMLAGSIATTPANIFALKNSAGDYIVDLNDSPATYSLFPEDFPGWSLTSQPSYSVAATAGFQFADSLDFGFYPSQPLDSLLPDLTGSFPRCNTIVNYWISVGNKGTTFPSGIIDLQLDSSLVFESSNAAPDSIVGEHLYWSYQNLNYFEDTLITVHVVMPGFVSSGLPVTSVLTGAVNQGGGAYVYFSDTLVQTVVCAYDPNDKTAEPAGLGAEGYISAGQSYLDYCIRFQNTGNDTALAVVISDQLDPKLLWTGLEILSSSHPVEVTVHPDGEAFFVFDPIYLPDSTTNEPGSHGFVKYRIPLIAGLQDGDQIHNTASIYFDQNPAVITNTTLHTIFDCSGIFAGLAPNAEICENSELSVGYTFPSSQLSWVVDDTTEIQGMLAWQPTSAGLHTFQLTVSNTLCESDTSFSIWVNPVTIAALSAFSQDTICSEQGEVALPPASPAGGSYTGAGLSGNFFDPALATAGTHAITYTYIDSEGCTSADSVEITVIANPVVQLGSIPGHLCTYDSGLSLPASSPAGGAYTMNGTVISSFDPSDSGPGAYALVYTYSGTFGCSDADTAVIMVDTPDLVQFGELVEDTVCQNTAFFALPVSTPAGGHYTGTGVSGILFDPVAAGPGTHIITYSYTNPAGCTGTDSAAIVVTSCSSLNLETESKNGFSAFPNPFSTELIVSMSRPAMVILADLSGRIVYRSWRNEQQVIISKDQLGAGTYLLYLRSEADEVLYCTPVVAY